jgi:Tfp pilus assembly protein PilO
MDLYEDLNRLIIKNALRNTSGPNYAALDPAGSKTPGKTTNTKWQNVYPGLAVDVTVEGSYQNIRRFVSELENSKQFVIINQVELQRAMQNNSAVDAATGVSPETGSRASIVSLQLNLATYFQRRSNKLE